MAQILKEIDKKEGQIIFKCSQDGEVLWREYLQNNIEVRGNNCSHFEWIPVGNGCYPDPMDEEICRGTEEIVNNSIKKIEEGTSIWFLVPRQS
jgi:hypothetical protein